MLLCRVFITAIALFGAVAGFGSGNPADSTTVPSTGKNASDYVVVKASRADPDTSIKQHSAVSISSRKIKNTPGAAEDISRYLGTLPSVVSSLGANYDNTLYVRGGRPSEIMFLVDGIELENINHFSQADGCGGPIGFLNSDFVRNARFYAGNIPVSYPGRMSSIVDIDMRNGSFSRLQGDAGLKLTGGLASCESPIAGRYGSLALAGRYVDFSTMRTFIHDDGIPQLGDGYGKIMFLINKNLTISGTGLFSYNTYRFTYPVVQPADDGSLFGNSLNEKQRIVQGGAGMYVHYKNDVIEHQVYASFSGRNGISYDSLGEYADSFPTHQFAQNPIHENRDNRVHYTVHSVSTIPAGKNQTLSAGVRLNETRYDFKTSDQLQHNGTCIICQNDTPVSVSYAQKPLEATLHLDGKEFGFFGDHTFTLGRWQNSIGVRVEHYGLLGDLSVSPRCTEMLSFGRAGNLIAGVGLYNQFPTDLPVVVFNYLSSFPGVSSDSMRRMEQSLLLQAKPLRCWQGSIGYDINTWDIARLKCELYCKWYDREYRFIAPDIQEVFTVTADGKPALRPQDGKRKAYGLELSLNNLRQSWYFYSLGYSLFDVKNRFGDARWYNDWTDVGYTYSLSAGTTFMKFNSFSLSVQGSGGRPFCPEIIRQDCIGRKSAMIDNTSAYYGRRLQRLLTTNAKYSFTRKIFGMEIESAVEIINLLNYKPVLEYKFNGIGFQEVRPFGITPIVGFTVHF
jgi:hypothetical protein